MTALASLLSGWLLDLRLGDPPRLPHPIVYMGRWIAFWERKLNHGKGRRTKGAVLTLASILLVYLLAAWAERLLSFAPGLRLAFDILMVFFCLAGTTLRREVRMVFAAADRSLGEGRTQVQRIVGRDTSELTDKEVRIAALETLAENLSDGVVAPLMWWIVGGVPAMMAYKMINTLDSMIAYRTERYRRFGTWAARIDDLANYLPARLTALLLVVFSGRLRLLPSLRQEAKKHLSPNSGWPEAALALVLGLRFGGPHVYHGEVVEKPNIGHADRAVTCDDCQQSLRLCFVVEAAAVFLCAAVAAVCA